jgi:transcriptional regulator GlxA family with amidase domain
MASGEPGFETIVSRLADILVVQAVRAHLAQDGGGCKGGRGRSSISRSVGRALSLIHEKPEDDWTVESLASRSECRVPRLPRGSRSSSRSRR